MRKNVTKVFKAWLAGQASNGSKNAHGQRTVWTDGFTIFSYRMPIASRTGTKSACISRESPTVTTSCHLGSVRAMLSMEGFIVNEMDAAGVRTVADMLQQGALDAAL